MIIILSIILITSIWILGIKIATHPDMIFGKLGSWAEKKVESGYEILNPLLVCEFCMPSIHSIVGYFIYWQVSGLSLKYLWAYPVVVAGASFLTGSLWALYNMIVAKHIYYETASGYYDKAEKEKFWELKDRQEKYRQKKSK